VIDEKSVWLQKACLGSIFLAIFFTVTWAEAAPISIVGSSTVYPFSKQVAEILAKKGVIEAPNFSVTGSGRGIKLFCASNAKQSPDITNASRRIKDSELETCHKHGVKVIEMIIGYDGIVIVSSNKSSFDVNLTRKDLFLALAALVPNDKNTALISNHYKFWDEINAKLPHQVIRIIGSPKGTGTRDTFEHHVMNMVSRDMPIYLKKGLKKYHEFRQDGVFLSDGEDHGRTIKMIEADHEALAIFGYSYFSKNSKVLKALSVDGYKPNIENIRQMNYPLARPLYFYFKKDHLKDVKGMSAYIESMMSDAMIGDHGACTSKGLIPLHGSMRSAYRMWLKYGFDLSAKDLHIQPQ